jgi:hypothetical protein
MGTGDDTDDIHNILELTTRKWKSCMKKAPILLVVFLYVCRTLELDDSAIFLVLRSISHFGYVNLRWFCEFVR